jgi:hypothetical protein
LTPASTWASTTSAQYAGAQLMSPIAASICDSSTVTTGPTRPKSSFARCSRPWSASGSRAWQHTPLRTSTGVLGMIRTTGVPS